MIRIVKGEIEPLQRLIVALESEQVEPSDHLMCVLAKLMTECNHIRMALGDGNTTSGSESDS